MKVANYTLTQKLLEAFGQDHVPSYETTDEAVRVLDQAVTSYLNFKNAKHQLLLLVDKQITGVEQDNQIVMKQFSQTCCCEELEQLAEIAAIFQVPVPEPAQIGQQLLELEMEIIELHQSLIELVQQNKEIVSHKSQILRSIDVHIDLDNPDDLAKEIVFIESKVQTNYQNELVQDKFVADWNALENAIKRLQTLRAGQ